MSEEYRSDEQELEARLVAKGLTHPRIKPSGVDEQIEDVAFHVFPGTTTTVCCITLRNGFTVIGESACASPENFDKAEGESIAFINARDKIWQLEGYLLKEKLHQGAATA